MAAYANTSEIAVGTEVFGSDGAKLGKVAALTADAFVVEKGFFFPTDFHIPLAAVASFQDGKVYLSVPKEDALQQRWNIASATDVGAIGVTPTMPPLAAPIDARRGSTGMRDDAGAGMEHRQTAAGGHVNTNDALTIQVREEELTATKTSRQTGEVRIEKDVIAEERVLEVPVTEERVRVQRRVVDRPVTAADGDLFQDEVIEVPVYGEDVQLQKSVRVTEEVEIGKEAVQSTEQVRGTVRREEVRITDDIAAGVEGVIDDGTAVIDPTIDRTGRSGASGI